MSDPLERLRLLVEEKRENLTNFPVERDDYADGQIRAYTRVLSWIKGAQLTQAHEMDRAQEEMEREERDGNRS